LIALVTLLAIPASAGAQELEPSLRDSIVALDDRANDAWLYETRTLVAGYPGATLAISTRALAHGAALIELSEEVAARIEAAGHHELAEDLRDTRTNLAETMCPSLSPAAFEAMSSTRERERAAHECETTSDLLVAIGEYAGRLRVSWADLAEIAPADCSLARLHRAGVIRQSIEALRARLAAAHSTNANEDRRELVAALREHTSRLAAGDRAPSSLEFATGFFPAPLLARYRELAAALDAAPAADRPARLRELVVVTRQLAASPNPYVAEIARFQASVRALEQLLAAYRSGAAERVLARHLARARGGIEEDEIVAALETRLREPMPACAPR
jgi:hypothetical protein